MGKVINMDIDVNIDSKIDMGRDMNLNLDMNMDISTDINLNIDSSINMGRDMKLDIETSMDMGKDINLSIDTNMDVGTDLNLDIESNMGMGKYMNLDIDTNMEIGTDTNTNINFVSEKKYQQYMYSYPHKITYQKVENIRLRDYQLHLNEESMGLYFHVPFCESKCGYCNLFSVSGQSKDFIDNYINAVKRHSKQMRRELDLSQVKMDSLVFGGGTPMLLSIEQLKTLFELAVDDYKMDLKDTFVGIETSPNQTTEEKLMLLKDYSVDRISIGVQSFIQQELNTLERYHSVASAHKALENIKKHAFKNVNIDLIYGIPGQNKKSLMDSIKQTLYYNPDEVFVYPLYSKPHTRIHGKFIVNEDAQYQLYLSVRDELKSAGYYQTSMRRFVKAKPENHVSCGFENMLALGCGGRTYLNPIHFCEPYQVKPQACRKSLEAYMQKENFLGNLSLYVLNREEQKRRFVIKNLLHTAGLHINAYDDYFKANVLEDFPILMTLIQKDWACMEDKIIRLNDVGLSLSDVIGPMFISEDVKLKMERYCYD